MLLLDDDGGRSSLATTVITLMTIMIGVPVMLASDGRRTGPKPQVP